MIDRDEFDTSDLLELSCARLVFGTLIQKHLNELKSLWNNHYIRKSQFSRINGRPNELCHLHDPYNFVVDQGDYNEMRAYVQNELDGTPDEYEEYFKYLVEQLDIDLDNLNWDEAKEVYFKLLRFAR